MTPSEVSLLKSGGLDAAKSDINTLLPLPRPFASGNQVIGLLVALLDLHAWKFAKEIFDLLESAGIYSCGLLKSYY
jgi:hypothetical protein